MFPDYDEKWSLTWTKRAEKWAGPGTFAAHKDQKWAGSVPSGPIASAAYYISFQLTACLQISQ